MINIMLDLETLGVKPGYKILSIGAVVFNTGEPLDGKTFYAEVERSGQDDYGMLEDKDTIKWWSKQDPSIRDSLFSPFDKLTLRHALIQFTEWLDALIKDSGEGDNKKVCVWGNGYDMDNVLLLTAFSMLGLKEPWRFWGNRCYRTLKNLFPEIEFTRAGNHHNALDDAISQANHATKILKHIELLKTNIDVNIKDAKT